VSVDWREGMVGLVQLTWMEIITFARFRYPNLDSETLKHFDLKVNHHDKSRYALLLIF
jgi:hypothetical protein